MLSSFAIYLREHYPKFAANIFWSITHFPIIRDRLAAMDPQEFLDRDFNDVNAWNIGGLIHRILQNENSENETVPHPDLEQIVVGADHLFHVANREGYDKAVDMLLQAVASGDEDRVLLQLKAVVFAGMLEDPEPVVIKILERNPSVLSIQLVLLMICCNIFDDTRLFGTLSRAISMLSLSHRNFAIDFLYAEGQTSLALRLSNALSTAMKSEIPDSPEAERNPIYSMPDHFLRWTLHQRLSEDTNNFVELTALEKASTYLRCVILIDSILCDHPGKNKDVLQVEIDDLFRNEPEEIQLKFELSTILSRENFGLHIPGFGDTPWDLLSELDKSVAAQPRAASIEQADAIVKAFKDFLDEGTIQRAPVLIESYGFSNAVKKLLDLCFPEQALLLAQIIHDHFPADLEILHLLSVLYEQAGDLDNALTYCLIEAGFHVDNPVRIKLYRLYFQLERWHEAYAEMQKLSANGHVLSVSDKDDFARLALLDGDALTAVEISENLIAEGNQTEQTYLVLGEACLETGQCDVATERLEEALDLYPSTVDFYPALCEGYRQCGLDERGKRVLINAAERFPGSATIQVELAREQFLNDQIAEGLPYLNRAAALQPDTKHAAMMVAKLLCGLGDIEGALAYLLHALDILGFRRPIARTAVACAIELEDYEIARKIAFELCEKPGANARDYIHLCETRLLGKNILLSEDISLNSSQIEEVFYQIEKAELLRPDLDDWIILRLLKAETLAYTGKFDLSMKIIREVLERNLQADWRLSGDLGVVSFALADYHTAIAALQESYQQNPGNKMLERYLSEANLEAGLFSDALFFAQKVFERNPGRTSDYIWYAGVMDRLGEYGKAVDALERARRSSPEETQILAKLCWAYFRNADFQSAKDTLSQVEPQINFNPEIINELGQIYVHFNEWERLASILESNLELFGEDQREIYLALAMISQRQGDLERAFEYSQNALELMTDNVFSLVFQADILYGLNKLQAARSLLDYVETIWRSKRISQNRFRQSIVDKMFPKDWVSQISSGEGILARKVLIYKKLRLDEEIHAFLSSRFEHEPSDLLRCLLADLDLSRGAFQEVRPLLEEVLTQQSGELFIFSLQLLSRWAILFDEHAMYKALLEKEEFRESHSSEMFCVVAKSCALEEDWSAADQAYHSARKASAISMLPSQGSGFQAIGYHILEELARTAQYWVYDTASVLHDWDFSITSLEDAYRQAPFNRAIQFGLLKMLVNSIQWAILANELGIQSHRYHPDSMVPVEEKIEQIIGELEGNSLPEVLIELVDKTTILLSNAEISYKDLNEKLSLPKDLEFLAALLLKAGKQQQLSSLADKLGGHFRHAWFSALCHLGSDLQTGYVLAQQAIDESKYSPITHAVAAIYEETIGNSERAYDYLSSALTIWPDETQWQQKASQLAESFGDTDQAIVHLETVIQLEDDLSITVFRLVDLYFKIRDYKKAVELLHAFERRGIINLDGFLYLGEAYYYLQDTDKAFEYADKARHYDQSSTKPDVLFARICEKLGEIDAAMGYARKALGSDPENQALHLLLANLLEKAGNRDEALQLLESIVLKGDVLTKVMIKYIQLKKQIFGPESVLALMESLREDWKEEFDLSFELAEAYYKIDRLEEAKNEAIHALKIQPGSIEIHILLANINHKLGQLDLAVHHCVEALNADTQILQAYLKLAEIYIERRQVSEALGIYKQAIQKVPGHYLPYYHAGVLLRETKDYKESEVMLKHAARLAPADLLIRRQLSAVVALNLVHNVQEEKFAS